MRLLIVVPSLGAVYGGPSRSVIELAQALGKSGISVDLVSTNANGKDVIDETVRIWIQKDNYRVRVFPCKTIGDYKLSFSITQWLFKNVKNYDLVQTNAIFSVPNLPAYLACRWNNVPYVVIPRGMLEPWALSHKAGKKKIYYNLFEKPALQKASALQMLASTEAQKIQTLNLKSPLVISPNGVHRKNFEALPTSQRFYGQFPETRDKKLILFLGRIDPKKGLDLLAKAFGKIRPNFPDAHLVVAGPDNVGFLPTAKKHFSDSNCLDAVTFTGILTGESKYSALAAADYYIAPSYSEGFSMSVLEGMAAGLPCIITTGCNFPEAAEANAAYVVEVDADAIADALFTCLTDPDAAVAMGKQARQFIFQNYTWDQIAKNLHEVYQKILDKQSIAQYAA